jgi:glycopeptide antibiotics resistance protein
MFQSIRKRENDSIASLNAMKVIEFFPYPLVIGILIQTGIVVRQRHRGWLCLSLQVLFGIYLMGVADLVVFPIVIPDDWPENLNLLGFTSNLNQNINLIPFDYRNMFSHLSDGSISPYIVLREIGGNILLTMPFGFGIHLFRSIRRRNIIGLAIATGLILEGAQLLIILFIGPSMHSVDINDVILNALGVLVGYICYQALIRAVNQVRIKRA